MGIIGYIKTARDNYVIRQVQRARLPQFSEGETVRVRVVFEGRVQKVGFRLEVSELAERLGLTGFCENLSDGAVRAELQGTMERIEFLISFMRSLKRIRIDRWVMTEIPCVDGEVGFETK